MLSWRPLIEFRNLDRTMPSKIDTFLKAFTYKGLFVFAASN
jgi:hypothetical protein